jgi:3-hydroxyacyl-CoA dehydrogenase
MPDAFICDYIRTPIGRYGGALAAVRTDDLAALPLAALLARNPGLDPAAILEEGIAARPSDIDLVLIHGYGFPRWRGGPLFHADRIGLRELVARIDGYAAADPVSWRVPALLRQLANEGRDFVSLSR